MNKRVAAIIEEARQLTPEERQDLLELLQIEFAGEDEGTPEEIEAAWLEEVERRIEKAERGETTFATHDEVFARIRERFNKA